MIYTSYFSKWKGFEDPNYVLMATTYYKPEWFSGEWFFDVAPKKELVEKYKAGEVGADQYTDIYLNYLTENSEKILAQVRAFDPNKTYILLCFEGPDRFCHRHVLSSWLRSKGIPCEEYNVEKFSYSKLSTYEGCGFKYKLIYKEKHFVDDSSIATEFGTLIHHIEEVIAKKIINEEEIDYSALITEFYNINTDFDEWKQEDDQKILGINFLIKKYPDEFYEEDKNGLTYADKMERYVSDGIHRLENFIKNNPGIKIVGVEHPFNIKYADGVVFHGFIDRILYDTTTGDYLIEDIKTYSAPLEHKDLTTPLQFVFYVIALKELFPDATEDNVRCFYELPLCGTKQEAGTKGFLKRGNAKIEKLLAGIDAGEFNPHPTPLCHWCVFSATKPNQPEDAKNLCPYFCHWTRDNKDFSVEYEWMGEENHEAILEAFKNKETRKFSEDQYKKDVMQSKLKLQDKIVFNSKDGERRFILRFDK